MLGSTTPVQNGTVNSVQVAATGSVVIGSVPGSTSWEQLWMFSCSGWVSAASSQLWSCDVVISGDGITPISTVWTMRMPPWSHSALPTLLVRTTLAPGTYQWSVNGNTSVSVWDVHDTMQVGVIELDHSGFGGGR